MNPIDDDQQLVFLTPPAAVVGPEFQERLRWAWKVVGDPDNSRREEAIAVLECFVGLLFGWHRGI